MCDFNFTQINCAHILTPRDNTTTTMLHSFYTMPTHNPPRPDAIQPSQDP
jgi:hypothetical protein